MTILLGRFSYQCSVDGAVSQSDSGIIFKTFFSNDHWKYAGQAWGNSDDAWFSTNEINVIQDSYEFMEKCPDPADANNSRCKVWRVIFPSNADIDEINNVFDVKDCFRLLFRTRVDRTNNGPAVRTSILHREKSKSVL